MAFMTGRISLQGTHLSAPSSRKVTLAAAPDSFAVAGGDEECHRPPSPAGDDEQGGGNAPASTAGLRQGRDGRVIPERPAPS